MIKELKNKDFFKHLSKYEFYLLVLAYLSEQEELILREMINQDSFKNSAWSEFQAYKLGMLKAFSKVKEFLPDQGEISE